MAELNPAYEKKHEETYLNYSRGADAPNALRTPIAKEADRSIGNVGDIILGSIQAKDTLYKERIRQEVTTDVDNWRDPYIGVSTSSGSPDANVPADLRRQIERMDAVSQTAAEGKLTDKHYWMQMENIARATRSRYPGYREYIDNVVSNITGGTPANVLAKMVANEAENLKSSATKRRDWVEKELLDKGVSPASMGGRTTQELETRLAEKNKVEYDLKLSQSQTNLMSSKMALDDKFTEREANYQVNKALTDNLSDMLTDYRKSRDTTISNLRDNEMSPGELAQVEAAGLEYKNAAISQANAILDGYSGLTPDGRKTILASVQARVDQEIQTITAGNTTTKELLANSVEYVKTLDSRAALEDMGEVWRTLGAVDREMGGQIGAKTWIDNGGRRQLDAHSAIKNAKFNLAPVDFGRPPPKIGEHTKAIIENPSIPTNNKGEAITQALDTHIRNLTVNPNTTPEVKANIVRSLYDEKSPDFINRIDKGNNDDIAVFQKMNSPTVTKTMEELRAAGYSEEYKMWDTWREINARALYSGDLDTMKNINVNSTYLKYKMNPDGTLDIEYTFPRGRDNDSFAIDSRTPGYLIEMGQNWALGAEASKNRVNGMINAMRPLWDAQGLDPVEQSTRLLAMNGFDLNPGLRPNTLFESFTKFLQEMVDSAVANQEATKAATQYYSTDTRNYRMPLGMGDPSNEERVRPAGKQLTPVEGIQMELEETLAIIQESPDPATQEEARARYKGLQKDLDDALKQQREYLDNIEKNFPKEFPGFGRPERNIPTS